MINWWGRQRGNVRTAIIVALVAVIVVLVVVFSVVG
jgi:hypothetical protein